MGLKLRLDLGLGNQPLKLAALIIAVWLVLSFVVFHDSLTGPWDAATRDMLVLIAVPPVVVLCFAGVLRVLGNGRG
ncbi:hypothetical protein ACE7GA_09755 [Roseomonas sp. CCTCC AB2023176]|uniref:hypothetical protein n=1 Tax=Roseomonas sp. CCTCC AB2023176 TaxID=3342640 RepID=UPI0035E178AA